MFGYALFFWIVFVIYVMSGGKFESQSWDCGSRYTSAQMKAIGNRHGLRNAKRQMRRMMR